MQYQVQGHWFRLVQVDFTHDGPMKKIPLLIIEEVLCSTIAHFSNESLLFIRFIFGLAYYYQTYFSNWVELSFRIRDECFIWLRELCFRGPVASIFQGLVIFLLD